MEIDIKLKNLRDNDINQIEEVLNDLRIDILKGYNENIKHSLNNFFVRNNYNYEVRAIGKNGK